MHLWVHSLGRPHPASQIPPAVGRPGQVEGVGLAKAKPTDQRPETRDWTARPRSLPPRTLRTWPELPPAQPVLAAVQDFDFGEIPISPEEAEMIQAMFLTLDLSLVSHSRHPAFAARSSKLGDLKSPQCPIVLHPSSPIRQQHYLRLIPFSGLCHQEVWWPNSVLSWYG